MKKAASRLALFLIFAATFGCDRVTKHFASTALNGAAPRSFASGVITLEYAENTGAFLSLGADLPGWSRTIVLIGGPIVLMAGMLIMTALNRVEGLALWGVVLTVAGGMSNLIDRLFQGSVIDFLNIDLGVVRTGIFNVADVAVTAGILLFVVAQFFGEEEGSAAAGR